MIKCEFKKKRKPERDKRVEDFKRKFDLEKTNEATLKRLNDELEHSPMNVVKTCDIVDL